MQWAALTAVSFGAMLVVALSYHLAYFARLAPGPQAVLPRRFPVAKVTTRTAPVPGSDHRQRQPAPIDIHAVACRWGKAAPPPPLVQRLQPHARCGNAEWLGTQFGSVGACAAKVMTMQNCSKSFFVHAEFGDKNCACVPAEFNCTLPCARAKVASLFAIDSAGPVQRNNPAGLDGDHDDGAACAGIKTGMRQAHLQPASHPGPSQPTHYVPSGRCNKHLAVTTNASIPLMCTAPTCWGPIDRVTDPAVGGSKCASCMGVELSYGFCTCPASGSFSHGCSTVVLICFTCPVDNRRDSHVTGS